MLTGFILGYSAVIVYQLEKEFDITTGEASLVGKPKGTFSLVDPRQLSQQALHRNLEFIDLKTCKILFFECNVWEGKKQWSRTSIEVTQDLHSLETALELDTLK